MTCLLSCLPQLTPTSCGRWLPLVDTGSAGGFFLWKGSFSFPLSLSDWTSKCWGFLCIVGSANAVVIWWSINKIESNYFYHNLQQILSLLYWTLWNCHWRSIYFSSVWWRLLLICFEFAWYSCHRHTIQETLKERIRNRNVVRKVFSHPL